MASPATTGERASGRSTTAFSRPLPRKLRRTIARAQSTPKIVFNGTAMSASSSVSQSACLALGVVTASHAGPKPSSKVRQKTSPTGTSRIAARYASTPMRRLTLAIMPRRPAAQSADDEQDGERDREQHERKRRGARDVLGLEPPEDVDGRHLRLERQVPGDEDDRAELADGARERERDSGENRRQEVREDDPAEDRRRARTKRRGRLLHLGVQLEKHGLHRTHDERQRHEQQRQNHARLRVR